MPKIVKLSKNITPFAGISYVNAEFFRSGLAQLIDTELGSRSKEAKYAYSDIFRTWFNLFLCGGECAEDVQVHLRPTLAQIPDHPVPSADTLLLGIKELATDNTEVVSTGDKAYQFNINEKMNDLMIKSLLLTGQLEAGKSYDFDYDNQIIAHDIGPKTVFLLSQDNFRQTLIILSVFSFFHFRQKINLSVFFTIDRPLRFSDMSYFV